MTDVEIEAKDAFDLSLNKVKTMDASGFGIRVDRGIKIYTMGIPSSISSVFGLQSMPAFVTDFGKGRLLITVNFTIHEGSRNANELEFLDWSEFVRINAFKSDNLWLRIGDSLSTISSILTDSSLGIEGKVLKLHAISNADQPDAIYCTLMFVHCIELNII